jgi:hypothetical protein
MLPHSLRISSFVTVLTIGVALTCLNGCKKSEEAPAPPAAPAAPQAQAFNVTRVDLGNAIGDDKKVTAPSTSF